LSGAVRVQPSEALIHCPVCHTGDDHRTHLTAVPQSVREAGFDFKAARKGNVQRTMRCESLDE
jgi:hypothetical protein